MSQVDQVTPGHFHGPTAMRFIVNPEVGNFYHDTENGNVFHGDGAKWLRAWSPAEITYNAAFPGYGLANNVLVSEEKWFRIVYGTCRLQGTSQNAAALNFFAETTPGVYVQVGSASAAASAVPLSRDQMFFFIVQGSKRYYIAQGGLSGVTENVLVYNITDF